MSNLLTLAAAFRPHTQPVPVRPANKEKEMQHSKNPRRCRLRLSSPTLTCATLLALVSVAVPAKSEPVTATKTVPIELQVPFSCPDCDLIGEDFSGRDLTNANFAGADLQGADFSGATLTGAVFIGANLEGASFDHAELDASGLGPARLSGANLANASFTGAELDGTDLQSTDLSCADFSDTDLTTAVFGPRVTVRATAADCQTSFAGTKMSCELLPQLAGVDLAGADLDHCEAAGGSPADPPVWVCGSADLSALTSQVYVEPAKGVDQPGCGPEASPCESIGYGISQCAASGCGVLVQHHKKYRLASTIVLRSGVNVYGGCGPNPGQGKGRSWFSTVEAPAGGVSAFSATGINTATLVQGFQISGSDATGAGLPSVAMTVADSPALTLVDVTITAGAGGAGAAGDAGPAGSEGSAANGQSPGSNAACPISSGGQGGNGRSGSVDTNYITYHCTYDRGYLNGFSSAAGAAGGSVGPDKCYQCGQWKGSYTGAGTDGTSGWGGSCGTGGPASASTTGNFSGTSWAGTSGDAGQPGTPGAGGGGGGGGGFCGYLTCSNGKENYGGHPGGGGGAGGCGGGGAAGGQQGGASFALVVAGSDSVLEVQNVTITGGQSGAGGPGGTGGAGGAGAGGASGSDGTDPCESGGQAGGTGGAGASGGGGGGGGGGNSGPAIGIALVGGATVYPTSFAKPGNNGTASCDTFCAGSQWPGGTGACLEAEITSSQQKVPCSDVPGFGNDLTCTCLSGAFVKPGNNGTASCDTFCAGSQWPGGTGACLEAGITSSQQKVPCSDVPGLGNDLTCTCLSGFYLGTIGAPGAGGAGGDGCTSGAEGVAGALANSMVF